MPIRREGDRYFYKPPDALRCDSCGLPIADGETCWQRADTEGHHAAWHDHCPSPTNQGEDQ